MNAKIYQHSEKHGLMPETQAGFRAGRSTLDMVFVLRMAQEIVRAKDHPLFVVFVDLVTAYDSVVRDGLWRILRIKGVPENLVALLKTFYEQKKCARVCGRLFNGSVRSHDRSQSRMLRCPASA